eukprot:scaffold21228_cov140-Isochrysis_galbana.AAC.3
MAQGRAAPLKVRGAPVHPDQPPPMPESQRGRHTVYAHQAQTHHSRSTRMKRGRANQAQLKACSDIPREPVYPHWTPVA